MKPRRLGRWVNRLLARAGLKLIGLEKGVAQSVYEAPPGLLDAFRDRLVEAPLDSGLHFELALAARERGAYCLARAELLTARYLGLPESRSGALLAALDAEHPDHTYLNHNVYYRLQTLAEAVKKLGGGSRMDVLDVGGGLGVLADFLPGQGYCLADPGTNGISGTALPFADGSFDVVVCCHVLEHVPQADRDRFLDELLRCARTGVILLNPFHKEGTFEQERLQVVLELTGAGWAREHLECSLPSLASVTRFAEQRSLDIRVEPNGTLTTTFALVFVDHFSRLAGRSASAARLNRFLNERFSGLMDSQAYPTGYLVTMTRRTEPDDSR